MSSEGIRQLRHDLVRALSRIKALEEIVFHTAEYGDALETVEAVRAFIRKIDNPAEMAPGAVAFISERLPVDWRTLVQQHGHPMVFKMLANNYTIIEARRQLK